MTGVLVVYDLNSGALQYEDDRLDLASPNGAPTVVLLLDAGAMAGLDVPTLVRGRRSALHPSINLLVIAPETVGEFEDCAGSIRAPESEITRMARLFGVGSMPATVLLDAAGYVLWVSGGERTGNDWRPLTGGGDGRVSGAVGLGDLTN
ncbi:MAG TPA: hypothetical protein VFQ54_10710 [Thermomicrobiales bacterium]|nr:hypothetical protein [Thermomicrobiales bacterium]